MKTKSVKSAAVAPTASAAVDVFMAKLKHPLKAEIEAIRKIIGGVTSDIAEEIKWNAPSFRTTESFATLNLRAQDGVQIIFHLVAKVRKPMPELKIADPAGLMKWLAKDRCLVALGPGNEIEANRAALAAIVRAWIKYL